MGRDWQARDNRSRRDRTNASKRSPDPKRGEDWQEGAAPRKSSSRRRREVSWAIYALISAVLIGALLIVLLRSPIRTPVIVLVGTDYSAPIRPNAWVEEDVEALKPLADVLQLELVEEDGWRKSGANGARPDRTDAYKAFRSALQRHDRLWRGFRRIRKPVVVYVSMPGGVNRDGQPCIITPGAKPWDSTSWLPVETIVRSLQALPAKRPKILILDSNQQLMNWRHGVVYNTFAEHVDELMVAINKDEKRRVENLAVITAAGPGQASCASAGLGGTAFGKYLQLGFAGAADQDGDREVSLSELTEFLQREVKDWALENRGLAQTPQVYLSREKLDFLVSHEVKDVERFNQPNPSATKKPSIDADKIAKLWDRLARLKAIDLRRFDPLALANYEHRLLRLEQLAMAGSKYKEKAGRELARLQASLPDEARLPTGRAVSEYWGLANVSSVRTVADRYQSRNLLPSLSSCEYFGVKVQVGGQDAAKQREVVEDLWRQMIGTAEPLPDLTVNHQLLRLASQLETTQLIAAARQQKILDRETGQAQVTTAYLARKSAEELALPLQPREEPDSLTDSPPARSLPGDERIHHIVRRTLDKADVLRRRAEDELFVGSPLREIDWGIVSDSLNRARSIDTTASFAIDSSDRVCAELPYLAEWYCLREVFHEAQEESDFEKLRDLARRGSGLRKQIDDLIAAPVSNESDEGKAGELRLLAENLIGAGESDVNTLLKFIGKFETEFGELAEGRASESPGGITQRQLVLAAPLANPLKSVDETRGQSRIALLLTTAELDFDRNRDYFSSRESADSGDDGRTNVSDDPKKRVTDRVAPIVLAMLGLPEESLDRQSDRLNQLDSLNRALRDRLQNTAHSVMDSGATRADLARREFAARKLAPISGAASSARDPVSQLREYDLQMLALWHAQRALDGFWATVTSPHATTVDDFSMPFSGNVEDLFSVASESYLEFADNDDKVRATIVETRIKSLRQRRAQLLRAAETGVAATGQTTADPDVDDRVGVSLQFGVDGLPAGRAAVRLVKEEQYIPAVWGSGRRRFAFVDVPVTESGQPLTGEARLADASGVKAELFFRGHEYPRSLVENITRGRLVTVHRPEFDRTSVRLVGSQLKPLQVVFVLDCSSTMKEEIKEGEQADADGTRMGEAKHALKVMLQELASRRNSPHVGVLFFGHRVGWQRQSNENTYKKVTSAYEKRFATAGDRWPAHDVEVVLPLGAFDSNARGDIERALDSVSYYGQTPVNLAIIEALRQFKRPSEDSPRSIIVITDGLNDQWHPKVEYGFGSVRETNTDEVVRAFGGRKDVPVYTIGFNIEDDPDTPNRNEKAIAEQEFKRISDATEGDWLATESAGALLDFLRMRLKLRGYRAYKTIGNAPPAPIPATMQDESLPFGLGDVVDIDHEPEEFPVLVDVEFEKSGATERVELEGGEAIELAVSSADQIVASESALNVGKRLALERPGGSSRLELLAIKPVWQDPRVTFRFALRDTNPAAHYTKRPAEVWVEIEPQRGDEQPYVFYDRIFQVGTSLPTIEVEASNWPADADTAVVRFWCKYDATPPDAVIELDSVSQAGGSMQRTVAGVELSIELTRADDNAVALVVKETHNNGTLPTDGIRLSVESDSYALRPKSMSHRTDNKTRKAQHVFTFDPGVDESRLLEDAKLIVTSAQAVKRDSFQTIRAGGMELPLRRKSSTIGR